jgi:hypothetical protein
MSAPMPKSLNTTTTTTTTTGITRGAFGMRVTLTY